MNFDYGLNNPPHYESYGQQINKRSPMRDRIAINILYYALNISDVLQGALFLCDNCCNDHTHVRCIKARKRNEGG